MGPLITFSKPDKQSFIWLLVFISIFCVTTTQVHAANVMVNDGGGQCPTSGSNGGLRIFTGDTGQFQVERCSESGTISNSRQFYNVTRTPTNQNLFNGIFLRVGNDIVGSVDSANWFGANLNWDAVSNSGGSALGDGTATTVFRKTISGVTYTLTQTVDYVMPNDFYTLVYNLDVPSSNTQKVRLYHWTDIMLDGNDNGYCLHDANFPEFVGAESSSRTYLAGYRQRNAAQPWDRHHCGRYSEPPNQISSISGDLSDTVRGSSDYHDIGAALQWNVVNFGAANFTTNFDLVFSLKQPQLTSRFGPDDGDSNDTITSGDTTSLTFTIVNVPSSPAQSGMNFTDTLPVGVSISGTPISLQCGGTVTTGVSGGRATVTVSGATFNGGDNSCDIVLDVTSNIVGDHNNPPSDITGINNLVNAAGATLTVTSGILKSNLSVIKFLSSGAVTYTPGNTDTYVIEVTNNGPADISGFQIVDSLPSGVTMAAPWTCVANSVSSSCSMSSGGTIGDVSVNLQGDLVDGDLLTINIPVLFNSDSNAY